MRIHILEPDKNRDERLVIHPGGVSLSRCVPNKRPGWQIFPFMGAKPPTRFFGQIQIKLWRVVVMISIQRPWTQHEYAKAKIGMVMPTCIWPNQQSMEVALFVSLSQIGIR